MQDRQHNPDIAKLTDLPVPDLLSEQLQKFTAQSIHSERVSEFDVKKVVSSLTQHEGSRVLGADFGGDKGATRLFEVRAGKLVIIDDYADDIQGDNGAGYVESIERAAAYAEAHDIPLGISWGGPMDGTKVVFHPKARQFMASLAEKYDGDLKNISPQITAAINDGPAGLISGAVAAYQVSGATNILFVINGGGLGLAAAIDGSLYAAEPGHVEGIAALNTYNQTAVCGVYDAQYTCVEQLGANKAGIEAQWQLLHDGNYMRARNIEDEYKAGDTLAGELYDHSALVVAHMIAGTAQVLKLDISNKANAIVCHGGAFKFPYYGARIEQILNHATGSTTNFLMIKDYTDPQSNACLDGAAIAAVTAS